MIIMLAAKNIASSYENPYLLNKANTSCFIIVSKLSAIGKNMLSLGTIKLPRKTNVAVYIKSAVFFAITKRLLNPISCFKYACANVIIWIIEHVPKIQVYTMNCLDLFSIHFNMKNGVIMQDRTPVKPVKIRTIALTACAGFVFTAGPSKRISAVIIHSQYCTPIVVNQIWPGQSSGNDIATKKRFVFEFKIGMSHQITKMDVAT